MRTDIITPFKPLSFIFVIAIATAVEAVLTNITVDDNGSDPVTGIKPNYTGPSHNEWEEGATCACSARVKPDPSQALDGTWHDSTFHDTDGGPKAIQFSFTGASDLCTWL